jgi:hypothetical protein
MRDGLNVLREEWYLRTLLSGRLAGQSDATGRRVRLGLDVRGS